MLAEVSCITLSRQLGLSTYYLRDPTVNATTFRRLLKTHFFSSYLHVKRIRGKDVMCYINTRYLLTAKNPKCNGIGFNLFLKVCREGA